MDKHKRILAFGLLCGVLGTGWLDFVTGPRVTFLPFYLGFILAAAWYLPKTHAWLVTGAAVLSLFGVYVNLNEEARDAAGIWNFLSRTSLLSLVGHLTMQVRSDRERLDQLLKKRTADHVATVEQLRHRDRLALAGQIAAGIAHELGTPLNVISGRARLILEPDATADETRSHVGSILEQSERVTATIRQLLDFVRRRGLELGAVDLQALSHKILGLLRPLAAKRGVELIELPPIGYTEGQVDYNQIQQALTNLIMNAVQAMPSGGQVRVQVRAGTESKLPGDWLCICIEDTGTGIAEEDLPRIFEPFFTTQKAGEGTGLGLSITEGIVRDHGGHIEVKSQKGSGSSFKLFLPRLPRTVSKEVLA